MIYSDAFRLLVVDHWRRTTKPLIKDDYILRTYHQHLAHIPHLYSTLFERDEQSARGHKEASGGIVNTAEFEELCGLMKGWGEAGSSGGTGDGEEERRGGDAKEYVI
jgi:hypothetical protein